MANVTVTSTRRLADLYPDEPILHGEGPLSRGARRPSREAIEARDELRRQFAALPRCRCGLLLPCYDCLPTTAVEFAELRMVSRPHVETHATTYQPVTTRKRRRDAGVKRGPYKKRAA